MTVQRASSSGSHASSERSPLLGWQAPASKEPRPFQRVPTFMQASVPNRRSILHAFGDITIHMLFELVLPLVLYYTFRLFFSALASMMLAGVPAAMIVAYKGIREHKVDMTGVLTLVMFVVSGLLAILQSDPKMYLLRESTMTLAMGIMLMGTLLPLQVQEHRLRPFMFYVARQVAMSSTIMDDPEVIRGHWDMFWRAWPSFRAFFRTLTGLWGAGLISEFIVRVVLLQVFDDVDDVLYYSNIYMFVILGILGTMTIASTLLFRHLYNREQEKAKAKERRDELDRIIQAAEREHLAEQHEPLLAASASPSNA